VEENGLKPTEREDSIFCFDPNEKCNKKREENRMRKLPVTQQIEKMVTYFMAYAAANESKY
jgi:hypothetical protein